MERPEYIKKIEGNQTLSVLHVGKINLNEKKFDEKNYTLAYIDSTFEGGKIQYIEKILITMHGFYVHLHKIGLYEEYATMCVYHKPQQMNELIIYIKQFLKQS